MILTISEIKTLAKFAGLVLTGATLADYEEDEVEIAVTDCPESGLIDTDAAAIRRYAHIAYFYEYPEEGSVGLGDELKQQAATDGGE